MTKQPYSEEFKIEAVKQITEQGHRVADVSARIGVRQHSLHKWIKAYAVPAPELQTQTSQTEGPWRLKAASSLRAAISTGESPGVIQQKIVQGHGHYCRQRAPSVPQPQHVCEQLNDENVESKADQ